MVGGLLTPPAVAVTTATPATPGVQTTGTTSESHDPAHAKPLLAMVSEALLLEAKWMVVRTA